MADLFPQTSDDQVITVPPGTHVGHIVLTKKRCRFVGTPGQSIIKLDNSYNTAIRATALCESVTTEGITWDCRDLVAPGVGYEINSSIPLWTSTNDVIQGHRKGSYAVYNRGAFRGTNLTIIGSGGALYHYTGSTELKIRGCLVVGGQFGFVNAGVGIGIDIEDLQARFDYWATPTYEQCTPTAYGATYVDVVSHVVGDRSLYDVVRALTPLGTFVSDAASPVVANARVWDRVEVAGVAWTQVLGVRHDGVLRLDQWRSWGGWYPVTAPVAATATLYRVSLGRLMGATVTRLDLQTGSSPGYAHWRGVEGGLTTPALVAGSRVDIVRHGLTNPAVRDVDTGIVHITDISTNAKLRGARARGGFSDQITLRGLGTKAYDCRARLGQDMGFTVDGTVGRQALDLCFAEQNGFNGFTVLGGPSDIRSSYANENGTHGDGYGASVYAVAAGSMIDVRCRNNRSGPFGASWIAHAQHARELTRVARRRSI